jgi:hypothetical protein
LLGESATDGERPRQRRMTEEQLRKRRKDVRKSEREEQRGGWMALEAALASSHRLPTNSIHPMRKEWKRKKTKTTKKKMVMMKMQGLSLMCGVGVSAWRSRRVMVQGGSREGERETAGEEKGRREER